MGKIVAIGGGGMAEGETLAIDKEDTLEGNLFTAQFKYHW